MKRFAPLMLVGAVSLAGCAENTIAPLAVDSPLLSNASSEFYAEGTLTGNHIVVMNGNNLPRNFNQRIAAMGGTVVAAYNGIGVAVVSGLSSEAAATLQAADDVQMVDADQVLDFLDAVETESATEVDPASHASPTSASFYPRQWNMRAIGADQAWAAGRLGSSKVTVAILDTGIDYTYPDLANRVDRARSRDFVTWTTEDNALRNHFFAGMDPFIDMHGHGTHVGNTVVSNGHIVAGVTQNVTLLAIKVLSARGSGSSADILGGIMYAADAGADVINMSLGGTFSKSANPGFVATINRAINYANRKGVTIVVSAGNAALDLDHDGNSYKTYCSSPNTVCVSATGPRSASSVNGPWVDVDAPSGYTNYGRSAIDVAAPGGSWGGSVTAACSKQRLSRNTVTNTWSRHTCSADLTRNYVIGMNGTSMASPHVSGLAALLVEDLGKNPGRIASRLHQSADQLGVSGNDVFYGKGRINAARAIGVN